MVYLYKKGVGMNEQSQAKSPEALRAMVAGTLANFQHPTLKHNLTTLKALHHVAWMDDTLHVELVMPCLLYTSPSPRDS